MGDCDHLTCPIGKELEHFKEMHSIKCQQVDKESDGLKSEIAKLDGKLDAHMVAEEEHHANVWKELNANNVNIARIFNTMKISAWLIGIGLTIMVGLLGGIVGILLNILQGK